MMNNNKKDIYVDKVRQTLTVRNNNYIRNANKNYI